MVTETFPRTALKWSATTVPPTREHDRMSAPPALTPVLGALWHILQESSLLHVSPEGLQALCALALHRAHVEGNHRALIPQLVACIADAHQQAGLQGPSPAEPLLYRRTALLHILAELLDTPDDVTLPGD